MTNAFNNFNTLNKKQPTKAQQKKTFAPVEEDIDLESVEVTETKQKTKKAPVKKTTKKKAPAKEKAESKIEAEEEVAKKPLSSLTSAIIVEGGETTVSKSFTVNRGNLDKLERLVKAGLFKNSSRALNAIINAVDVDELLGR